MSHVLPQVRDTRSVDPGPSGPRRLSLVRRRHIDLQLLAGSLCPASGR